MANESQFRFMTHTKSEQEKREFEHGEFESRR